VADLAVEAGVCPLHFLSPKDPRFGVRLIPDWGHEGRNGLGQWFPTAGLTRERRPEDRPRNGVGLGPGGTPGLASQRRAVQRRACVLYADLLSQLKPGYVPPDMGRFVVHPGVGATMRAHATDSEHETYLSYRQGYMISHCDHNQGDFVLHAKGAPLIDMSLFAYDLHNNERDIALNKELGWYSVPALRLPRQRVRHSWRRRARAAGAWNPSSEIHAHSFGDSVDYLRGASDKPGGAGRGRSLFLKGQAV